MLGDKLVKLRKKRGLSQQQVADLLGVSRQTISNWELDQGAPTLDKAAELAATYNVALEDLASDAVEVVSSGAASGTCDLHVLHWLVGKTVRLEGVNVEWALSSISSTPVHVLAVDNGWLRVSYERTKPSTICQKETVTQLIDLDDIEGAHVLIDERTSSEQDEHNVNALNEEGVA